MKIGNDNFSEAEKEIEHMAMYLLEGISAYCDEQETSAETVFNTMASLLLRMSTIIPDIRDVRIVGDQIKNAMVEAAIQDGRGK